MEIQTPYDFLRGLKESLKEKNQDLRKNKELMVKAQNFQMAIMYKNLEQKLILFIEELEFKNK